MTAHRRRAVDRDDTRDAGGGSFHEQASARAEIQEPVARRQLGPPEDEIAKRLESRTGSHPLDIVDVPLPVLGALTV
jgi:hypothetical protein